MASVPLPIRGAPEQSEAIPPLLWGLPRSQLFFLLLFFFSPSSIPLDARHNAKKSACLFSSFCDTMGGLLKGPRSSVDRAFGCGPKGRRFDSCRGRHFFSRRIKSPRARVAQLDRVPGFEPVGWGFESLRGRHLNIKRKPFFSRKRARFDVPRCSIGESTRRQNRGLRGVRALRGRHLNIKRKPFFSRKRARFDVPRCFSFSLSPKEKKKGGAFAVPLSFFCDILRALFFF